MAGSPFDELGEMPELGGPPSPPENTFGVCCGQCGGGVYMHACPTHFWTVRSECQQCGLTNVIHPDGCPECGWNWADADTTTYPQGIAES